MNAITLNNDLTALFDKREDLKSKIDDLQKELKIVNNSLKDQFKDTAQMQLAQQGKDFGQTSMNSGDFKVTVDFRKKVLWDETILLRVLNSLDEDTARHLATVKYSVSEAKFQNATPDLKAALSEARTVELQGISVDLKRREES
jgi:hypothetical protein|tara:strand:+ start:859 stop:1290 length:432 start_codon:yes stop_codon:yes gene_type:complete